MVILSLFALFMLRMVEMSFWILFLCESWCLAALIGCFSPLNCVFLRSAGGIIVYGAVSPSCIRDYGDCHALPVVHVAALESRFFFIRVFTDFVCVEVEYAPRLMLGEVCGECVLFGCIPIFWEGYLFGSCLLYCAQEDGS